jgi:predicted O-linked N-acetylglucosamine transferase (SPINDLY family)
MARVSASYVARAGYPELVAADIEGYKTLAIALARDAERIVRLRGEMRERLQRSALLDHARHTREYEAFIEQAAEQI